MSKPNKAIGATALADALTNALSRNAVKGLNPFVIVNEPVVIKRCTGKPIQMQQISNTFTPSPLVYDSGNGYPLPTPAMPDPREERKRREFQQLKITKLCAIIKRSDPRLLMEFLQDFGSIEGLSAPKQADCIKRLEKIKADYCM